jgi:hypothetical protein
MVMTLSDWAAVATITGAVAGVAALVYTGWQIRQNTLAHRAEFWLTLRQMFSEHRHVHFMLRTYEWTNEDITHSDWADLEAYMGLLEHCEIMLEDGLLDWRTFNDVYGYRILNILSNPLIVRDTLIRRRRGWIRFLDLARRMGEIKHTRYLSGFHDRQQGLWTLWWGKVTHRDGCGGERCWANPSLADGCCEFGSRAEMEAAYHARLAVELASPEPVAFAWLIGDDRKVVHRYPEISSPASPPQLRGAAPAT